MEAHGKLTSLQLELLKIFSEQIDNKQLLEIKDLLKNYFAKKITSQVDELWEQEDWDSNKIDELKNEHLRTKYE